MKTETLSIIANQQKLGVVTYRGNRLTFSYDPAWQSSPEAFPLSVSMPLAGNHHPHEVIDTYLWGLLPDNQSVLDQWGRQFHVSPRNVFRLLSHVGEDCPGAIQFIPEDKEDTWLNQTYEEQVDWLDENQMARIFNPG